MLLASGGEEKYKWGKRVSTKSAEFCPVEEFQPSDSKLAALNVLGAGDKMTNEWIEWNESARIVGRLPLRGNHHYHHGSAHHQAGVGPMHHGGQSLGQAGVSPPGSGLTASSGLSGIHNNNNVSFLNNNQQHFLNSYSLNKLAAAGMGLKTHALMKGLQKPRGKELFFFFGFRGKVSALELLGAFLPVTVTRVPREPEQWVGGGPPRRTVLFTFVPLGKLLDKLLSEGRPSRVDQTQLPASTPPP